MFRKNYYEVLGVSKTASPSEIKASFRQLIKLCHPDVAGKQSTMLYSEVVEAYRALSRPKKRIIYDAAFFGKSNAPRADAPPSPPPERSQSDGPQTERSQADQPQADPTQTVKRRPRRRRPQPNAWQDAVKWLAVGTVGALLGGGVCWWVMRG
ncbi:MAG: J domain-containing protein [Synergistaceae bacterium]|jgi:DnaJ-class molecular chaperone|nr:J domain-containing protein [Synergistaceae bacterium]